MKLKTIFSKLYGYILSPIALLLIICHQKKFKNHLLGWLRQNISFNHRRRGYRYLKGNGVEIGALNQPAILRSSCKVEYVDYISKEGSKKIFKEISPLYLVQVDHICDLDKEDLHFKTCSYDFVIANHIIEHLANPIKAIKEMFRIIKINGLLVISIPDCNYTYDKCRNITELSHLIMDYNKNVNEISTEHYSDLLDQIKLDYSGKNILNISGIFEDLKKRHEHVHVWNSESAKCFLQRSIEMLSIKAQCIYECSGDQNKFEYFSVWRKLG
jgi:SAM-dependent methyltransferase